MLVRHVRVRFKFHMQLRNLFLCSGYILGSATALFAHPSSTICKGIAEPLERLACYDRHASGAVKMHVAGKGGRDLTIPDAQVGDILVFRNHDAVMVITVSDAAGDTIQNLHLGGAGERRYSLPTSGTFMVQIDATGAWNSWLEPRPSP